MILRAEKVRKQYIRKSQGTNIFEAVKELDLILKEGTLTEITGRSGSGKSTLLNMLAGLLRPTSGNVYLEPGESERKSIESSGKIQLPSGKDLYSLDDRTLSQIRNQYIGVIPQGHTPLYSLNVLENILLPAALYGKAEEAAAYADELMELVDITKLKDAMPAELSGGELRRLSIARALICRPDILLADEPTGDLDDENTRIVLQLLRDTADRGTSVLLVTHEAEAANYADRIFKMNSGILESC